MQSQISVLSINLILIYRRVIYIMFVIDFYSVAFVNGLTFRTGAQDNFLFIFGRAVNISVKKFLLVSDFYNLETFLDKVCGKLP